MSNCSVLLYLYNYIYIGNSLAPLLVEHWHKYGHFRQHQWLVCRNHIICSFSSFSLSLSSSGIWPGAYSKGVIITRLFVQSILRIFCFCSIGSSFIWDYVN